MIERSRDSFIRVDTAVIDTQRFVPFDALDSSCGKGAPLIAGWENVMGVSLSGVEASVRC